MAEPQGTMLAEVMAASEAGDRARLGVLAGVIGRMKLGEQGLGWDEIAELSHAIATRLEQLGGPDAARAAHI